MRILLGVQQIEIACDHITVMLANIVLRRANLDMEIELAVF